MAAEFDADFEAAADELYALPPERFVERRDAAAGAAMTTDPQTARAIRALKKPSSAAWLLNQLARANPDDVTGLLDLGAALRQAQSRLEGAQLRELSKQRRQAVNALVREARQLAVRLGKPASEAVAREVEQSLEAALASSEAAQAVRSGRLTTALTPDSGFDSAAPHLRVVREEKQHAGRGAGAKTAAAKSPEANGAAAKRALARAETAAAKAATDVASAIARRDELTTNVGDITEQIADLTDQLHELEQRLADAKRAEREAQTAVTAAERAARRADLALETARGAAQP